MPTLPPIDGLPLWAQLVVSSIICLATLGVAFKGYFRKGPLDGQPSDKTTASIMAASIMDNGTMRHLADVCIRLSGCVDKLTDAIEENTHYSRNNIELDREMCARLRELAEEMKRQGRDARGWDKRDEERR